MAKKITITKPTAEEALAEANTYIEFMTKAMNGLMRNASGESVELAKAMMAEDGFTEVPIIAFSFENNNAAPDAHLTSLGKKLHELKK